MNPAKRRARAARKAKAQRLHRNQGVPAPRSTKVQFSKLTITNRSRS